MKLEDLKDPWDDLGEDIEDNWQLDLNLLRQSYLTKASDKLNNLLRVKLFILCFFLAVTVYLVVLIVKNLSSIATAATLTFFAFWTIMVSLVLIYEVFLLKSIDYNEHLALLLKKLSLIKLSTIRLLRLGALLLPFNTLLLGYYIITGRNLIEHVVINGVDWVTLVSFIFCALVSYWLIEKISLKNVKKKWMYRFLGGNGSQVLDAIYFMNQISSLEQDDLLIKGTVDNKQ